MSSNTLLVDFDGVIRLWQTSTICAAEERCNVAIGTVFETAFADSLLHPVVTGSRTHSEWENAVGNELSRMYGSNVSENLVSAWTNETWEIDEYLLSELCRVAPNHKFVLVTNATDRLQQDLIKSGLESRFDFVINSSQFGIAKPDADFFRHALIMSNSRATDCIYIDDSLGNVSAAQTLGIKSVLHESIEKTLEAIKHTCT